MRIRPTVRLIVIDKLQRLLLFKIEDKFPLDPNWPDLTVYWATPGGGLEAGETHEQAGIRELWEETGIRLEALGPWVWSCEKMLHFPDEVVLFQERYYLTPVSTTEVALSNLTAYEQEVYRADRWWSLAEMEQSSEVFLPRGLIALLSPLLRGELPPEPICLLT